MLRPTPTGLVTGLSAPLLLAVGVLLGYPEVIALGVGAIAVVVLAGGVLLSRAEVRAEPPADLRVERGSDASVHLVLRLERGRRMGGLRVRDLGQGIVVGVPPLSDGRGSVVAVPVPTARRGAITVGPWRLERTDAWGLVTRRLIVLPAVQVLVLPRVHPVAVSSLPMAEAEGSGSEDMGTTYVATLREYVVGDELRHVHWRSSAKAGHLMVRQFVDSRRPGVDVVLDVGSTSYADADAFEEAVDAAASVAASVAATGVPTSVLTTAGDRARAGRGRHAGMLDLLAEVGRVGTDAAGGLPPSPRSVRGARGTGATVVFVTGTTTAAPQSVAGRRRVLVRVGPSSDPRRVVVGPRVLSVRAAVDLAGLPSVADGRSRPGRSA